MIYRGGNPVTLYLPSGRIVDVVDGTAVEVDALDSAALYARPDFIDRADLPEED
jgi:hypothetical protein